MKQSMVDYMNTICEKDFFALKRIINHKFRKFRSFYWLLKDYTDDISHIHYDDDTDLDLLRISVQVSGFSAESLAEVLIDSLEEDQPVNITNDDTSVYIEIFGEEEPEISEEDSVEISNVPENK